MSLSSVLTRIKIWNSPSVIWRVTSGRSPVDGLDNSATELKQIITDIYSTAKGKSILDTGTGDIRFGALLSGIALTFKSNVDQWIGLQLDKIDRLWSFNSTGSLYHIDKRVVVAHELSHLLKNTGDPNGGQPPSDAMQNGASWNDQGATVIAENLVASQLHLQGHDRVSYFAAISDEDYRFNLINSKVSYTNNQMVDLVRIGDNANNNQDHSLRTEKSRDLILGFGGEDTIKGGEGNDHLYGGGDKDLIDGGKGNDRLFGEQGDDKLLGSPGTDLLHGGYNSVVSPGQALNADGNDTASYVGFLGASNKLGIEIGIGSSLTSITYSTEVGFNRAAFVKDLATTTLRDGATDTLISIEKIIATTSDDRLVIGSLDEKYLADPATKQGGLREVDLGTEGKGDQNGDLIDLSSLREAAEVDLHSPIPFVAARTDGTRRIDVSGAERVTGSAQGDIIRGAGTGTFIDGGAGDDEIHLYNGDVAIGGPGADSFYIYTQSGLGVPSGGGLWRSYILDLEADDKVFVDGVQYTGYVETPQRYGPHSVGINVNDSWAGISSQRSADSESGRSTSIQFGSDLNPSFEVGHATPKLTNLGLMQFSSSNANGTSDVYQLWVANLDNGDAGIRHDLVFHRESSDTVTMVDGLNLNNGDYNTNIDGNDEPLIYRDLSFYNLYDKVSPLIPLDIPNREHYIAILRNQGSSHSSGTSGNDTVSADVSGGLVFGEAGDDTFYGGYGRDTFYGGAGNDKFFDIAGSDYIDGGIGNDTLYLPGNKVNYKIQAPQSGGFGPQVRETVITSPLDSNLKISVTNVENIIYLGDQSAAASSAVTEDQAVSGATEGVNLLSSATREVTAVVSFMSMDEALAYPPSPNFLFNNDIATMSYLPSPAGSGIEADNPLRCDDIIVNLPYQDVSYDGLADNTSLGSQFSPSSGHFNQEAFHILLL